MTVLIFALSALLATLCFTVLGAGIRHVPDGEAWVIHRRSRYSRILRPGWRFVWPLLERVVHNAKLINHRVDLPLRNASDPSITGQRATLYYQIIEPERSGARLADIDHVVEEAAREQASALSAAGREIDVLAERLKPLLNLQLGALGLRVTRCQLPGA